MKEHGAIRIGFLSTDPAIFFMDKETGQLTGTLAEYVSYAKDCLGNQTLEFVLQEYDPYLAEEKGYALTNTAWTYSLMAVTDEKNFDENEVYTVAVPKEKEALKQHIAFSYPQWKLADYDSLDDAADMDTNGKGRLFPHGSKSGDDI